jgi:hypothetical protein
VNLSALAQPAGSAVSGRFFLVSTLPTTLAVTYLLVLVWAGAPGPVRFAHAWRTAAGLGTGQILLLVLVITSVGVVTMPLQLPLVRWLEGYWPDRLEPLAGFCRTRQGKRRDTLVTELVPGADLQRAGETGHRQRTRYPVEPHRLRPTALGNALTAAETRAGRAYGLDAPVVWLRLEPLLGDRIRTAVADRRDAMDAATRMSVTVALCVPPTVWLLWRSGWWLALAALLAAVSRLGYVAAVHAAVAYGQYVEAAFDLHRFDLLTALHLPLPEDRTQELATGAALSTLWRQGHAGPPLFRYDHGPGDRPPPQA